MSLAAPTNVLTRNIGNGSMDVQWDPPATTLENLLKKSEKFDASEWTKVATTITPNGYLGDDGTMTADLLAMTPGHFDPPVAATISQPIFMPPGWDFGVKNTVTFTIWLRSIAPHGVVQIGFNVYPQSGGVTQYKKKVVLTDTLQRFETLVPLPAIGEPYTADACIYIGTNSGSDNIPGAIIQILTKTVAWGAQVVRGHPTPIEYVPTDNSVVVAGVVTAVMHYDIYIASNSSGPFDKANTYRISEPRYRVNNLKFGSTIYTKVKAFTDDGDASAFSALAKDATCDRSEGILQIESIPGDQVPAGTIFAAIVDDELVAFKTIDAVVLA